MIFTYPNQKIVTVHKAPADKDHFYGILNKEALFNACRELTSNELKVFLYAATNQQGYQMALSTTDIAAQVGSTVDGIRTAIRGLVKKGYMEQDHGNYYTFYELPHDEKPNDQNHHDDKNSAIVPEIPMLTNGKTSGYQVESEGEIIKEEYRKSTINYIVEGNLSNSKEWDEIFGRIRVQCYPHTLKRLENVVGTELDARVVGKIVNDKWSAFENKMFEQEGYRLNTLVNLLEANYTKYKYAIAAQDAEYRRAIEESRNQPRIDYDLLCASRRKEHEGLDDISALLDEMFEDYDDAV